MDKRTLTIFFIIIISGVAYYLWQGREADLRSSLTISSTSEPSVQILKKDIDKLPRETPVADSYNAARVEKLRDSIAPAIEKTIPLPDIDSSDEIFREDLERLYNSLKPFEIFIFNDFARHVVVSIDNLTAKKLPQRFSFTTKPETQFMVHKSVDESELTIEGDNYNRYGRYIDFANTVSIDDMLIFYLRYYPLFQQAYEELGYPETKFNNRLIEVINHLLETPVMYEEVRLIQPKVFYLFADSSLENLSAGQKLLIRSGPENTIRIKSILKKLQFALLSLGI